MSVLDSRVFNEGVVRRMNDGGMTIPGINIVTDPKSDKFGQRSRKLTMKDLSRMPRFNMDKKK